MSGAKKSGGFAAALAGLDNLGQVSKEGNDIGLGDRLATPPAKQSVPEIDVALIDVDPDQPRQAIDQDKLRELADSIGKQGLIQPIVIRRNPNAPARYIITAGERRFRATLLLGLTTIQAVIKEDLPDPELAALVENVQREDLTPIETARAISKALKKPKVTASSLAAELGWPVSRVSEYAAVARMPPAFVDALSAGVINDIRTLNDAASLAKTYPEEVTKLVTSASPESPLVRAQVRKLGAKLATEAARPKGGKASKPLPPPSGDNGDGGDEEGGQTGGATGNPPAEPLYARVFVSDADGEIGYLDLAKPGAKAGAVFVIRDGGISTIEQLAELKLSRVAFL
ncbi:MAG: hypothetical protein A2X76_01480 [Lysobacterales bacterium GWF1_69_6]|nr:MAG: hypothetical protein A2X76_01480 [Xanthomonadales bacterium GWF1_69_6]